MTTRPSSNRSAASIAGVFGGLIAVFAGLTAILAGHGAPSFVFGLLAGAMVALVIGLGLGLGVTVGARRAVTDRERLDEIDPLGDLPQDGDR